MASTSNLSALRLLILSPCQPSQSNAADGTLQESTRTTSIPSPFPPLLRALTSTSPSPDLTSFAGYTSHPPLHLKTKYYDRRVGIWCDELPPVAVPKSRRGTGASASSTIDSLPSPSKAQTLSQELSASPTKASTSVDALAPSSPTNPPHPTSPITSPPAQPTTSISEDPSPETPTLKLWKTQLLSTPAQEVLLSIGAIILILPIPSDTNYPSTPQQKVELMEYISAVNEVKDAVEDVGRDVGCVILLQPDAPSSVKGEEGGRGVAKGEVARRMEGLVEKFEDKCHEMGVFGWDFVWWDGVLEQAVNVPVIELAGEDGAEKEGATQAATKNVYGEKVGIERIREVLEGVDWSVVPSLPSDLNDEDDNDAEDKFDVLGGQKYQGLDAELQQEMMGLKISMMDSQQSSSEANAEQGEDISIDQMSALMERVVAIREAGADMDKEQRERFAKREVEKIMQEIG